VASAASFVYHPPRAARGAGTPAPTGGGVGPHAPPTAHRFSS
jgi:hypothetical protein